MLPRRRRRPASRHASVSPCARAFGLGPALATAATALALTLTMVGTSGCPKTQGPPPSAPSPLAQQNLPAFARPTLAGGRVDTETLKGQVVVIKFFAKYCEPCKRTLPAAEDLHRKHPEVAFVGVSEDEYASDAQALVSTYGLSFPVVHDQGNVLAGRFRVREMPVTFVVDRQGVVQWIGGPGQDEDDLAAAIAAYGQ